MRRIVVAGLMAALLGAAAVCSAQVPGVEKEHQWLQQLVGEWEAEVEVTIAPGQPPLKSRGTESVRTIGGLWVVAEGKNDFMGTPMASVMTLGYDPEKKKYVGTWVDSFTSYLWKYEGTVDAAGKVLTLEAEGPNPTAPGKLVRFREVIEVKSKDHKVFSSSQQTADGKWNTFVTVNYRRKG